MKRVLLVLLAGLLFCTRAVYAEPIWIDVRTAEEYAADHIDSDIHIPLAELDVAALATQYGKDAEVMLYCRSGNRAGQALEALKSAGFTNVSNAGGIGDVRTLRGMAVQSPVSTAVEAVAAPAR